MSVDEIIQKAVELETQGQDQAALAMLLNIANTQVKKSEVAYLIGVVLYKLDQNLEALEQFGRIDVEYYKKLSSDYIAKIYFLVGDIDTFLKFTKVNVSNLSYETLDLLNYVEVMFSTTFTKRSKPNPKSLLLNALFEFVRSDIKNTKIFLIKSLKHPTFKKFLNELNERDKIFFTSFSKLLYEKCRDITHQRGLNHKKNIIYHIGESHCLDFVPLTNIISSNIHIVPKIIFGTKIYHLAFDKSNYRALFEKHIHSVPIGSRLLISFGEIDARHDEGFMVQEYDTIKKFKRAISITMKSYFDYLDSVQLFEKFTVTFSEIYYIPHADEHINLISRRDLITAMNAFLRKYAYSRGAGFLRPEELKSAQKQAVTIVDKYHLNLSIDLQDFDRSLPYRSFQ